METKELEPTVETTATAESASAPEEAKGIEERITDAISTVYDPEIPVNIYELGLIYGVEVREDGHVDVKMTLTSPSCPAAGILPGEVEMKVKGVEGVASAEVEIVWDPVWNPSMMSEAAQLELGMF